MAAALQIERRNRTPVGFAIALSLLVHALLLAGLHVVDVDMPDSTNAPPLTAELGPAPLSPALEKAVQAKTDLSRPVTTTKPPLLRPQQKPDAKPQPLEEIPAAPETSVANTLPSTPLASDHSAVPLPPESRQELLDTALVGRYRMALICALKRHRSYPTYAQKREWTGKVRLRVEFSEGGVLRNVQVLRSSGHSILDENAVETVRKGQADMPVPARLLGHSFSVEQEIEYQFDTQPSTDTPVSCPSV